MKRRVAVDARMIGHSGIGVVLRGLLGEWSSRAPAFDVTLFGDPAELAEYEARLPGAKIVAWRAPIYSFKAAIARFPKSKYSALYAPHYATAISPGVPLVCHIQDLLHITHPPRAGTKIYARLYLAFLRRNAAFALTSSRHVKVQLQTLYGFRADRVLCTGLGPGIADGAVESTPSARGDYLLAVGIVKPHKNWPFLFSRFAANPAWPKLICAGSGRWSAELRDLAKKHGVEDRVEIAEHLSDADLVGLYRGARGLVFPSIAEGFGLPVLEAMKLGTPVVVADRSPMKEIAEGCGFAFNPDYPESFDAALNAMLNDDVRRAKSVRAGIELARTYTWEKTVSIVEQALMRAMTGKLPTD